MTEKYIMYNDKGGTEVPLCTQAQAAALFDTGAYEIGMFVISADGQSARKLTDKDKDSINKLADEHGGSK
jgi:hypothetical protein